MPTTLSLTDDERRLLIRTLRVVFPHDRFGEEPYARTADAVVEAATATPRQALMLRAGLRDLQAQAFDEMDEQAASAHLESLTSTPFFGLVHGTGVVALYDDHDVWDVLGYEGPSYDHGGYLDRGFDDLDWLPEPRITEPARQARS